MERVQIKPVVDKAATKRKVKKYLMGEYRDYLDKLPSHIEPKITSGFSITPPDFSNANQNRRTEDVATAREVFEETRNTVISSVTNVVSQLDIDEQYIITKRFLQHRPKTDTEIYMGMNISPASYKRKKAHALERLGFLLEMEVYMVPMNKCKSKEMKENV